MNDVVVMPSGGEGAFPPPVPPASLSDADREALRRAVAVLEGSTLTGRLSDLAGKPLDAMAAVLPQAARDVVSTATEAALKTALKVALTTLPKEAKPQRSWRDKSHTALAAASGALGGALGLATLPVELPLSTTLILRAIAEIAQQEGEDLSDPLTALNCLEVFALGSRTDREDLASGGYFAVRSVLAKSVTDAARLVARSGLTDRAAPAFIRLTAQIASRFGLVVSQKVAAGAIPIVGAIGGAAINAAFMEHFRAVAKAHFTVRRLERTYGAAEIAAAYALLRRDMGYDPNAPRAAA